MRMRFRRLKMEMEEISKEQESIKEGQRQVQEKFEAIEEEYEQLWKQTNEIIQQTANAQIRLALMFNILRAREEDQVKFQFGGIDEIRGGDDGGLVAQRS
ncbi:hypothetical protein PTKIN_Ptkin14bG0091300 [Pterospermum kingtungense]